MSAITPTTAAATPPTTAPVLVVVVAAEVVALAAAEETLLPLMVAKAVSVTTLCVVIAGVVTATYGEKIRENEEAAIRK